MWFKIRALIVLFVVCSFFVEWGMAISCKACTLWAAAGKNVAGNGVLAAKTRDWPFNYPQVMHLKLPAIGYRHFGLYEQGNEKKGGVKMGINEKGLFVASATSSIPRDVRRKMPRIPGLNRKLLEGCASVKEALAKTLLFVGPRYLILADSYEIAVIEIGDEDKCAIQRTANGVLGHTNHYVNPDMTRFNPVQLKPSTLSRYKRITAFLSSKPRLTPSDFLSIASSKEGGPNNSIWRDGLAPNKTRTLAYWIVHYPPKAKPTLYVRILQPGSLTIQDAVYNFNRIFGQN